MFIVEQPGRIRIVSGSDVIAEPFLDITDRVNTQGNERGLLGLAFHPHYPENGFFFERVPLIRISGGTAAYGCLTLTLRRQTRMGIRAS